MHADALAQPCDNVCAKQHRVAISQTKDDHSGGWKGVLLQPIREDAQKLPVVDPHFVAMWARRLLIR